MIESWEARMSEFPCPPIGQKVARDNATGRVVPGIVVAAAVDERTLGGWIVVVRWWLVHRKCWNWQVYNATDFVPYAEGDRPRVRLAAKRGHRATGLPVEAIEASLGFIEVGQGTTQ